MNNFVGYFLSLLLNHCCHLIKLCCSTDFREVLDEFDSVIESAAFFSIDCEFTGLFTERTPPFTTPNEFYKKLYAGTDEYVIVQMGITAFHVDPGIFYSTMATIPTKLILFFYHFFSLLDNTDKYVYKSYNFYVYPQNKDQNIRCSGSTIKFLAEQKFDFCKLFYHGVSCCTQDVQQKLRNMYDERKKNREDALEISDERASNYDEVTVPLEEVDRIREARYRKRNNYDKE